MTMPDNSLESRLNSITGETLAPLVAHALEVDGAQVVDWQYEAVHGGIGEIMGDGIFLLHGLANAQSQDKPWKLILKIIRADPETANEPPSSWIYWKREALAYQSGLLDDLPGSLAAPRCFNVHQYAEDEIWIWLEAIPNEIEPDWSLQRYGIAARHLGQFNGAYFEGRPLPGHNWLSNGRIDDWMVYAEEIIPHLDDFLEHPLVKIWFPDESADRMKKLWPRRLELLERIRKLPRTLCHHDAFRRNLIAAKDQNQHDITYALDWSMIGIGVIGEEAATMLTVSMQLLDFDMEFAAQLDRLIFNGYLLGLRDTGWSGKSELVRFGFISSAFLFMALGGAGSWMEWIVDENHHKDVENFIGHPIECVIRQWSRMQSYLLDLADEALSMKEFIG